MRVLVIGSNRIENEIVSNLNISTPDSPMFQAATELGYELKKKGHTVLICSLNPDTVDPHVFEGAKKVSDKSSVELHVSDSSRFAPAVITGPARV